MIKPSKEFYKKVYGSLFDPKTGLLKGSLFLVAELPIPITSSDRPDFCFVLARTGREAKQIALSDYSKIPPAEHYHWMDEIKTVRVGEFIDK